MKYPLFFLVATLMSLPLFAQIDGDDLFQYDQVVHIDLEFPDANYWSLLTSNYEADENEYIPAHLTLTDETGTYSLDSVAVRLKGNSSYNHPGNKKSFKIDFNKYITGQNYDGIKKLNFSNGFKDPSMMREKVFFDVCRDAGVPAPRANYASVSMNGISWGFYTMIEQIDDQFLDWKIGDDDGNLFKAGDNFGVPGGGGGGTPADLVDYGSEQSNYADRYELKTNETENDWSDLISFIDFINNSSDEVFETELDERLEVQGFLRSAALDALFSNLDSYTGSARNYYLYHNLSTDQWEWIKWDGNEGFGSYSNNAGNMLSLSVDYHDNDRPLLERIFESDVLYERYLTEVCYLTENYFNSDYIDPKCDTLKVLIQDYVYADDNKMYSNAEFDSNISTNVSTGGGPGGGNVYGLKYFVEERAASIANQVDCSAFENPNAIAENSISQVRLFPNPAQNFVQVMWDETELVELELLNSLGEIVYTASNLSSSSHRIGLETYPSGLYFLRIFKSHRSGSTLRLVIQ